MTQAKHSLAVLAAIGALLAGVVGCGSQEETTAAPPKKKLPRVETITVETKPFTEILEATGEVVAVNTVTVEATVEGPISFCPWREGDEVTEPGQKLIEIDRPLYRQEKRGAEAALVVARAKLEDLKAGARPEEIAQAEQAVRHLEDSTRFAKADHERVQSLVKSGALPGEEAEKARVEYVKSQSLLQAARENLGMLEAGPTVTEIAVAQAAVEEAEARRDLAQARLDECVLKAPFAGVVTKVLARPGDLVTPKTPLLEMMEPASLVVRFSVPETKIALVRENAGAEVRFDACPEKTFAARIERVYPELERNSRTCLAEAKVLDPGLLLPGQFARVAVSLRTVENAIVMPDRAVLSTARGDTVVFVVKDGKAQVRKVEIGLEQSQDVEVKAGLEPGEVVVTVGNEKLKDGQQVETAAAKTSVAGQQPGADSPMPETALAGQPAEEGKAQ